MEIKVILCVMVTLLCAGTVACISVKDSSVGSVSKIGHVLDNDSDDKLSGHVKDQSISNIGPEVDGGASVIKQQTQDQMDIAAFRDDLKLQNSLIKNLLNRVDHLETREKELSTENEGLNKRINYLETREKQGRNERAKLVRTVRIQQRSLDSLVKAMIKESKEESENVVDAQEANVAQNGHKTYIDDSVVKSNNAMTTSKARNSRVIDGTAQPKVLEKRLLTEEADEKSNVAFLAGLIDHHLDLGVDQIIPFDNVITNAGDAYNENVGHFEAPVAGTYLFAVTIVAYSTHVNHYYFSKNGVEVTRLNVDAIEAPYASASQTAILELEEGDVVTIRNVEAGGQISGGHYSTFSGCLIYQRPSAGAVLGKRSAPAL